jgi:hypothetical protein
MSPKNSNDTIGNRTRDLPVCNGGYMTVKLRVSRSETHESVQAKFIFFFKGLRRVSGQDWAQCRQALSTRLSAPMAFDMLKDTWVIPKISWK